MMEISFTPSPDVIAILNALLDKFENRAKRKPTVRESASEYYARSSRQHVERSIKINLVDLSLPTYFSQTDPEPRTIANEQLQILENFGHLNLSWLPGESGHLLQAISLRPELHPEQSAALSSSKGRRGTTRATQHDVLYKLIQRTPISDHRARLESLLLAEKFRYPKEDWRAHALNYILGQLSAGKSPAPFSLSDSNLNLDLLAILQALPTLTMETPYRVFSVRLFNDTKRFDDLKSAFIRLARRAPREWKSFNNEDLLREFNLVANPGYVHLAGNWELTDSNGQIIHLDSFKPSVGFPASQITSLRKITIRAESVLCIENLTSFHQQVDRYTSKHVNKGASRSVPMGRPAQHAILCLMGNPSPAVRCLLRLIPEEIPIHLWSDMDYGGFNILAQLRRQVSPRTQPYLMDITTFDRHAHLSRPLSQSDIHNLKRLALNPALADVHATIHHLLKCGLKLEQEAIQI